VRMATDIATGTVVSETEWQQRRRAHHERADRWIAPHLERRRRGIAHPVMDFLFDYYPYSPGRLRTWHPGLGVHLAGDWQPTSCADHYVRDGDCWTVDPQRASTPRLRLALAILEGTQSRPAQFSCFGMHEWAMVYRLDPAQVRHTQQPLRLSIDDISEAVDDVGLRCTHIDAFRFFTDEAAPQNTLLPTRANQPDLEQPGCLHANMDLFKYAMWFQPYVPGELVLDCFELACQAREIDMRASPYDLADLGYEPIPLETTGGRQHYAHLQRGLAKDAEPIRERLTATLTNVAHQVQARN